MRMGKDMSAIRVQSMHVENHILLHHSLVKKCQTGQKAFVVRFRDKIVFHILYAHFTSFM